MISFDRNSDITFYQYFAGKRIANKCLISWYFVYKLYKETEIERQKRKNYCYQLQSNRQQSQYADID